MKKTSRNPAKAANFFKKKIFYVIVAASMLVIATTVTLSLTLTKPRVVPPDPPVTVEPVTMRNPINEFEVQKGFANDKLLWCTTLKLWETHLGIDLAAPNGTQVFAVLDGTVDSVTNSALDGVVIVISHAENVKTVYKSLGEDTLVIAGQTVKRGDAIGFVSDTMITEVKQAPHLHFEVIVSGTYVDPAAHLVDLIEK